MHTLKKYQHDNTFVIIYLMQALKFMLEIVWQNNYLKYYFIKKKIGKDFYGYWSMVAWTSKNIFSHLFGKEFGKKDTF